MAFVLSASRRLRYRGQVKPAGVPRIDWTHPLTKDLVYYAWEDNGNVVNLVNPTFNYTLSNIVSRVSAYGPGLYGTGSGGPDASYTDVNCVIPGMYDAICTIAAGFYRKGTSGQYGGPMAQTANSGSGSPYNNLTILLNPGGADSSQFAIAYASAGPVQALTGSVGGVTDEAFHVIGFHTETGGNHAWLDGADVLSNVVPYVPYTSSGNSSNQFGSSIFAGFTFFNAKWNRNLSADEHRSLYSDPYQFLIPSEGEMPRAYAPASTFNSAWARNRNTIIRKGVQL